MHVIEDLFFNLLRCTFKIDLVWELRFDLFLMPVLKRVWVEKFLEDVVAQTVDSCTRPTRLN